ncbi:hypothetical protein A2V80_00845 [Candidatus Woesebacteria bacterium RBG_16_39_8b]|uniref:Uncharacterized protein n=1 Tax=Candidatus Woesebacteria bacterium RBG_16_39_8b TaxID=1802482 RepID=A0A1F7XDP1_9BACT|nr:MAG: hypothetical protein A2V80_00845 [Candidatus Woesebacteria bacterium RBG_16_39_8b]
MTIPCTQEENIGKFKEFMENSKGLKATIFTIAVAILLQVGTFIFLWGGLTTIVKVHDKAIDRILGKLDNVKIVGYAIAGEKK